MSTITLANSTDPDQWAMDLAETVYNLGDWCSIQIAIIYTLIMVLLFLKYRNNVKYDKVALTVLILQFLAFMALMARSVIILTESEEYNKFQWPFNTLS